MQIGQSIRAYTVILHEGALKAGVGQFRGVRDRAPGWIPGPVSKLGSFCIAGVQVNFTCGTSRWAASWISKNGCAVNPNGPAIRLFGKLSITVLYDATSAL